MTANYEPQHDYYKAYRESRKDDELLEEVRTIRRILAAIAAHIGASWR